MCIYIYTHTSHPYSLIKGQNGDQIYFFIVAIFFILYIKKNYKFDNLNMCFYFKSDSYGIIFILLNKYIFFVLKKIKT